MAWAANLANDAEIEEYFVRATARIRVAHTSFSLVSGTRYSASFTHGPVGRVTSGSTALTEGASTSVSSGQWYYDRSSQTLYVNTGSAIGSSSFIVVSFYLFFSTCECLWYQTPDDSSTAVVQWQPLVKVAPSYRITIPPLALGYFPVEPTKLELVNDHSLNYILHSGSFNRTDCEVWHQLGARALTNFRKVLTGVFGPRISISEDSVRMDVGDRSLKFDTIVGGSYFDASTVDPAFKDTAKLKILGASPTNNNNDDPLFQMVDLDYNASAPTTSNNRTWGLLHDPNGIYTETTLSGNGVNSQFNPSGGTGADRFRLYDYCWFDADSGPGDDKYGIRIDSISGGNIFFTTTPFSGSLTPGVLRVSIFRDVFIIKNGETPYRLSYGRDYTQTTHTGSLLGITLTSSAEANVGCGTFDPSTDFLWASIVGANNQLTNDGNNYGDATSSKTGLQVLYQFLTEEAGLDESEIDFDAFTDAATMVDWSVFLPMPFGQQTEYPEVREVLDILLKTLTLRAYYNREGKFTIRPYEPIGVADGTILKEEILSYEYEIDYSEMKKIYLQPIWDRQNTPKLLYSGTKEQILAGTAQLKVLTGERGFGRVSGTSSNEGLYLHRIDQAIIFEHCATDTTKLSSRITDLYGERVGYMRITGKRIALEREPGDDVTVYRDSLPGFSDSEGNNSDFEVVEIEKAHGTVSLTLNDNKAAEDKASESYWS